MTRLDSSVTRSASQSGTRSAAVWASDSASTTSASSGPTVHAGSEMANAPAEALSSLASRMPWAATTATAAST